ncbi:periaxin [Protopterus annectens]|uniref:periaxin n=1 Tax=Protopterus annectens TaxID=7888 RepID=UPI001CFADA72|nr:periaxin [Protopterus annectens]XP_043918278.1 periaxin [Protopterus annectens]
MQTANMETQVKDSTKEEEIRSSELFELIMETEAQADIKGFNVAGGGKDGVFIKQLLKDSPADKKMELKEGDQLLSTTVYFDNVKYEDAVRILQCAQPYKVSFCLKRTIPGNEVTVPSGSESLDVKETKAKISKMAVKSITPVRKKKKTLIKGSGEVSDEAAVKTSTDAVEMSSSKSPADVEFSLPKFSKLKKGKGILGADIAYSSEVPDSDTKKKKLKFPRLKVKEVGATKDVAVEPKQLEGQSTSSPANIKLETEDEAKPKDRASIFTIHFPKSKKVKADTILPKGKCEISGLEIKEKMAFKPPDVEVGVSLLRPKAEGPHAKESRDNAISEVTMKEEHFKTRFSKPNTSTKTSDLAIKDQEVEGKLKMPDIRVPKVEISLLKGTVEGEENISVTSAEQEALKSDQNLNLVDKILSLEISAPVLAQKAAKEMETAESKGTDTATGGTGGIGEHFRLKMPSVGIFDKKTDTDIVETKLQSKEETDYLRTKEMIQMPEVTFPDFGILLSKAKKVESPETKHKAGMKLPSLEISAPKVEVDTRVPRGKTDTDIPPVDRSGEISEVKLKIPKVELPHFGITGSSSIVEVQQEPSKADREMKVPYVESKKTKIDSADPKRPKGMIPSVEISLPKEKLDVSIPTVEGIKILEGDSKVKMAFATAKMPSLDVSLPKAPNIVIELPKANSKMPGPFSEGDFDTGGFEMKTDTDLPELKFKMPKISLAYCDSSDKDGEPEDGPVVTTARTQIDIKARATKPDSDLYAADMQESKLAFPKLGISLPKIKVEPDASVQHTDMDISEAKSQLTITDLDKRKTDMDIKDADSRHSFPSVKIQTLDISMPEVEIDIGTPLIKESAKRLDDTVEERSERPDSKLHLTKVSLPKFGVKTKEVDDTTASAKVKSEKKVTKLETEVTRIATKCTGVKVESSKVALPIIGFAFTKESESNSRSLKPEINISDVNLDCHTEPETSGTKIKIPTLEVVHLAVSAPKIPDMDIDISTQKDKIYAKEGENTGTSSPSSEISTERADAKCKSSKFSLPKFGISGFKGKTAERDIKATPAEEEEMKSPDAKIKRSKLKMPTFAISLPKGKTEHSFTDTSNVYGLAEEVSLNIADSSIKKQKTKSKHERAEADMPSLDSKVTMPSVKLPKVDISAPKFDIDIGLPKTTTDGAVQLLCTKSEKPSEMNIDFPDIKVKLPRFSMPKIGSKNKGSDVEANYERTKGHVKVTHPNIETQSQNISKLKDKEGKEKMPIIKIPFGKLTVSADDSVQVDTKRQEADAEASDTAKTTFMKMPKLIISPPKSKIKENETKIETKFKEDKVSVCAEARALKHKVELGHETEGPDIKSTSSKIKMPSLEISLPTDKLEESRLAEVCVSDAENKECEGETKIRVLPIDISAHKFGIDICLPRGKSGPSVDSGISLKHEEKGLLSDSDVDESEIKLKMPKVELLKFKSKEKMIDTQITEGQREGSRVAAPCHITMGEKVPFDVTQPEDEADDKVMAKTTKGKMPTVDMSLPWTKLCDADICVNKGECAFQELIVKEVDTEDKFKLPMVELSTFSTTKGKAFDVTASTHPDKTKCAKREEISPKQERHIGLPHVELSMKGPTMKSSQISRSPKEKAKIGVAIGKAADASAATDVENHGSKFKIKVPEFGISFGKDKADAITTESQEIHCPSLTDMAQHRLKIIKLAMPEVGFSVTENKMNTEPNTSTNLDVNARGPLKVDETSKSVVLPDAKVGSLELGLNMLSFKVPKVGISAEKETAEGYETKHLEKEDSDEKSKRHLFQLHNTELSILKEKENTDFEIKGLNVDTDISDINNSIQDTKIKIPNVTLPSLGFSHSGTDKDQVISRHTIVFKGDEELKYDHKISRVTSSVPEIKATFPGGDPEKTNALTLPKIELMFSKVMQSEAVVDTSGSATKSDVEGADKRGKSKQTCAVVQAAHNDHGVNGGKMKISKVKKGVLALLNSRDKDADHFDIPEDSDMVDKAGKVLLNAKPFEAKLKIPKIKMKPTFGNSHPKSKGCVINGELEVSIPKDGEENEVKSSKLKFPKVAFSSSKSGSVDINVNGTASSDSDWVGIGESQSSFQNRYKAKQDKIQLPKVEFSTPHSKRKEGDLEMGINLIRTEDSGSDENTNHNGVYSVKASKLTRISIPGLKKRSESDPSSGNVSSEMVVMEKGDDKSSIKSPKSKIALGFISSKSKENYCTDSMSESGKDKSESKEKSVKFKIPKFSLSPKSRGVFSIISDHSQSEESSGCMRQAHKDEDVPAGFKMQMPKIGFKILTEEQSSEEQVHEQKKGRYSMVSTTKQIKTDSAMEKATTI